MFVRGLMQAAGRPPEDRSQAAEVIDPWQEAQGLLYAPLDDERYTPEEQAEVDAALEGFRRGEGVPLEQLTQRSKRAR